MKNIKLFFIIFVISCSQKTNKDFERNVILEYYPDSTIKSKTSYLGTNKDGVSYQYYSNGNIKSIETFSNNKKINDSFYYYENDSGVLKKYIFNHIYGEPIFEIDYDNLNDIEKIVGNPIYIDNWDSDTKFLNNDTVRYKFVVGDIPKAFVWIHYAYLDSENNVIRLGNEKLHNASLNLELSLKDSSSYHFVDNKVFKSIFIWTLYSNDTILMKRDTVIYELR